jgi:C-terminal peptidase prc
MRWTLACLIPAAFVGLILATGTIGDRKAAAPPLPRREAENYAQQLLFVIHEIEQQYARPVPPRELLRTALSGLYQAADVPVPPFLADEVDRAGEQELVQVAIRHREELGKRESLHGPAALLASVRALARSLDPHSTVVSGEELNRANEDGQRHGLGLELEPFDGVGPVRVKSVVLGSPAQRAGIRPGDQITHCNGQAVSADCAELFRAGPGRTPDPSQGTGRERFQLTLQRAGRNEPWEVAIPAGPLKGETVLGVCRRIDGSWDYLLKEQVAHIRLAALGRGTSNDLRDVLTRLKEDGVGGVILDLRWCPGGYLNEAVNVVNLFLKEGKIATVRSRTRDETHRAMSAGEVFDFPLVVLVNGETSGGAELIAAALQDHQRALVAGQRTLGKASVQTMLPLPVNDAGLKLTTGHFLRPSGKELHRRPESQPRDDWGVRPDPGHALPVTPELGRQLQEWWLLQSLRPGHSTEALPLDDPENDPQRQAAFRTLVELLRDRASHAQSR